MKIKGLLPLIGFLLFFLILSKVNLYNIASLLIKVKLEYVLLSASLSIPVIFLKAVKWRIIIRSYKIDYPLLNSAKAWLIGFFLGIITPGRIGDFSRAYYLRKDSGISAGKSLTTVIVDRIIDIALLFCLALFGMTLMASRFLHIMDLFLYLLFSFTLFLLSVIVLTRKSAVRYILKPVSKRMLPSRYYMKISTVFHDFYHGIWQMSKAKISVAVLICTLTWLISIAQYFLLSVALGLNLPYSFFFAVAPIIVLLDTLPVSFSGIGTRDAALIFFFSLMSISAEAAVSLSLLLFIITYTLTGFVGMLLWIKNPMKIAKLRK